MTKTIYFITVLLLISVISACNSEKNNFHKAKQTNTIEALKEFGDNYPNGEYIDSAKRLIDLLIWDSIKKLNTTEDYESFIEDYPLSSFVDSAKQIVEKVSVESDDETEETE